MTGNATVALQALTRRFLLDHPTEAARRIEEASAEAAAAALAGQPALLLVPLWQRLAPSAAADLLTAMPKDQAAALLAEMRPNEAIRLLGLLDDAERDRYLGLLPNAIQTELRALMRYPDGSAGRLMDTRVSMFRRSLTVGGALNQLRHSPTKTTRSLFLIDEDNKLAGRVAIQDLAVAEPDLRLADLAQPVTAAVNPMTPEDEVADVFERTKLADLAVVDIHGVLVGVIYNATLVQTVQQDATADMQTMVGASKEERALSRPLFAVRKRMPWLQINLLTAFLAAAVVGLFEDTIARFTALAVLLPVVAGQSGNAGAQALAVTMRGLALREISMRDWHSVTFKEVSAGFVNGIAIALTCGIGVFIWSGSIGLVLVIASSMILAMIAAGFAGAIVPITLTRLGQDPAQSSSIILTTVTDVAGFFSFLGIATLLAFML